SGLAANADDTLLAGSFVEGGGGPRPGIAASGAAQEKEKATARQDQPRRTGGRGVDLEARLALHLPMRLYTIDIATGVIKTFHPSTEWLNHVQFSPTDPTLIMFCHEGPWHKVDRIWTIREGGSELRKIHTRTMDMEIAGHEFFSPDGKIVWYD